MLAVAPADLFVYATSDTMAVEQVNGMCNEAKSSKDSSTMESNDENVIDDGKISTEIANLLGYQFKEEDTYCLIFGEELSHYRVTLSSEKSEDELQEYSDNVQSVKEVKLEDNNVVDITNTVGQKEQTVNANDEENTEEIVEQEKIEEEQQQVAVVEVEQSKIETTITMIDQSEALIEISEPEKDYTGAVVTLSAEDRSLLEHLVMGEAGGEGIVGAALVAQAIRDTMIYKGFNTVAEVRNALSYSGDISKEPNQDTLDAVKYIFDEGGIVVKHKIFYFYAPRWCSSSWHESQHFIIEYGGHKFFSTN